MGCGASKFDPEGDSVPAKIRPLLRRRLEEMRRRRHGTASAFKNSSAADLSKKELLKNGASDDDNSSRPNQESDTKSISSLEDTLKLVKAVATESEMEKPSDDVEVDDKAVKNTPTPPPPRSPKVGPEPVSESDKLQKKTSVRFDNKEEDEKEAADNAVEAMAIADTGVAKITGGDRIGDDNLYPGSPSFRVYFIESLQNKDDADADDKVDYDSDKKSQSEDSHVDMESNSNAELVSKTKKKTKKAYRLRKVIPMGTPAAQVKHLLNVKSCYNPGCTGHAHRHAHDNDSLLHDNTVS